MRTTTAVLAAACMALSACGSTQNPSVGAPSAAAAGTGTPSSAASSPAAGYTTGSDVTTHAAVGKDVAEIRGLLAAAKTGGPVDWAAIGRLVQEGKASKKGDGTLRTLAALSPSSPSLASLERALTSGGTDAVRAQQVDKGMVVILAEKVVSELRAAGVKVGKGELDPSKGAPHNVDEAYAFFVAEEQGPAATADKREKSPELAGKVRQPVVDALADAQRAAVAGDAAALTAATTRTQAALDHVFYLAVHRYLAHEGDAVARAEGGAFYLAIQPRVQAASPAADSAILATLAGGDTASGRAALNSPEVFGALGLRAEQRV